MDTRPSEELFATARGHAEQLAYPQGSPEAHAAADVRGAIRAFIALGTDIPATGATRVGPPDNATGVRYLRDHWSAVVAFTTLDARLPPERAELRERAVEALASLGRKALDHLYQHEHGFPWYARAKP